MNPSDRIPVASAEWLARVEQQREALIDQLCEFIPPNLLELLDANDGAVDHRLDWVRVPDPRYGDDRPNLEVLPILGLWQGESEEDGVHAATEPGLADFTLLRKQPGSKEKEIGRIAAIGSPHKPLLYLSRPLAQTVESCFVGWASPRAELFLKLAKAALDAQNTPTKPVQTTNGRL